jgi:hypothetical protein
MDGPSIVTRCGALPASTFATLRACALGSGIEFATAPHPILFDDPAAGLSAETRSLDTDKDYSYS